jgi:hypothetical protein
MSLSLDSLPPLKRNVDASDVKSNAVMVDKPFLLACSRDVTQPELDLLKSYGSVLVWHESFRNIPLSSHKFDYALFDLREKTHRDAIMKEDITRYTVICIVGLLDSFDDFVEDVSALNCIRTFPARQAFKNDFDRLLMSAKVRKPSCAKSMLRFLQKLWGGWPKE